MEGKDISISDITNDELELVMKEAIFRERRSELWPEILTSAQALREGHRGGTSWALDLIQMLALTVVISRKH
jgi:hypothetical protein